jgi:hypothetical protein
LRHDAVEVATESRHPDIPPSFFRLFVEWPLCDELAGARFEKSGVTAHAQNRLL